MALSRSSVPTIYALTAPGMMASRLAVPLLIESGVRWIQIREPGQSDADTYELVEGLVATLPAEVRLLINDRPDIALAAGADGVHLGQEDLPADIARRVACGRPLVIGVSTHSVEEAVTACDDPNVDYVAVGPIFKSPTKNVRDPLGLVALREVRGRTNKPLIAIGGIDAGNIRAVLDAGADSAAVLSALYRNGTIGRNVEMLMEAAGVR